MEIKEDSKTRDHQRWQCIDPKITNRPHKDYVTLWINFNVHHSMLDQIVMIAPERSRQTWESRGNYNSFIFVFFFTLISTPSSWEDLAIGLNPEILKSGYHRKIIQKSYNSYLYSMSYLTLNIWFLVLWSNWL